jgi:hypothetical protein
MTPVLCHHPLIPRRCSFDQRTRRATPNCLVLYGLRPLRVSSARCRGAVVGGGGRRSPPQQLVSLLPAHPADDAAEQCRLSDDLAAGYLTPGGGASRASTGEVRTLRLHQNCATPWALMAPSMPAIGASTTGSSFASIR